MDTHTEGLPENTLQATQAVPKKNRKLKLIVIGLLIVLATVFGFLYYKYPQALGMKTSAEKAQAKVEAEAKDILAQVGKLIMLPVDETPAIFEITDPQMLIAQQSFFTGAEKGDKLLIYKTLARAIVYSPSRNLIVNVGPVTQEQMPSQPTTPPVKTTTSSDTKKK